MDPNNLDDYRKGLWYRVKENNQDIKQIDETEKVRSVGALPCTCPHCKSDYSKYAPKRGSFHHSEGLEPILAK